MGADESYTSQAANDSSKSYDSNGNGSYAGNDGYGNPTYERHQPSYPYEMPTGRDAYGNPTYGTENE